MFCFSRCVFPLSFLIVCLQPGRCQRSIARPSHLSDHYVIKEAGVQDPWHLTCKQGTSNTVLLGRLTESEWAVAEFANAQSDTHCFSLLAYHLESELSPFFSKKASYESVKDKIIKSTVVSMQSFLSQTVPVKRAHSQRLVGWDILDEYPINTIHAIVRNEDPSLEQEGATPEHSHSSTDEHEITVETNGMMSATTSVGVPLFGSAEFSLSIGAGRSSTDAHSETKTIVAPSQKMKLKPRTQAVVSFTFYKMRKRNDYLIDFEVEETPDLKKLKERAKRGEVELKLHRGPQDPSLRLKRNKLVFGSVPATQILWGYGVNVTFGTPEAISDGEN